MASSKLKLEIAGQIFVPKAKLTGRINRFLRSKLFIPNSEYIIKQRLGRPVYDVPKFFNLIEDHPPHVLLPRGFIGQLTDFLTKERVTYEVIQHYPQFEPCPYNSLIKLTQEQERMVQKAVVSGQGVLVAPPGSGKTVMGLELIARQQRPALILTHRKQLLDQWVDQIQQHLVIPKRQIGRYSSAYKKPGQQVTVGLLQSFARAKDLADFANKFGVVVVDECHHIPAATFRAVVSRLNAPHIYGLTATPKRKHNDERLIYLYIGDIVATMSPEQAFAEVTGFDITVRQTSLNLPFDLKKDQFELLAKTICYDTARNEQIVQDITEQAASGRRTLVLSERKEHLKMLELYLRGRCNIVTFSGDDSASSRKAKLQQIKDGRYEVLLATGQIFGEGMHVPNIEALVLAFPFSFQGKLAQYVGRLFHSTEARQLIDYHDARVAVLDAQYKKRRRYYKKLRPDKPQ